MTRLAKTQTEALDQKTYQTRVLPFSRNFGCTPLTLLSVVANVESPNQRPLLRV